MNEKDQKEPFRIQKERICHRNQPRGDRRSPPEGLNLRYKAIFPNSFKREFRKLPAHVRQTLINNLEKIVENPYSGKRLGGKLEGLWRYRTGKYRLIYLINEKESAVVFLDVGPRKSIYK